MTGYVLINRSRLTSYVITTSSSLLSGRDSSIFRLEADLDEDFGVLLDAVEERSSRVTAQNDRLMRKLCLLQKEVLPRVVLAFDVFGVHSLFCFFNEFSKIAREVQQYLGSKS